MSSRKERALAELEQARAAYPAIAMHFVGFGGMDPRLETFVYGVAGTEVRIPAVPSRFPPERVAKTYLCVAAFTLREAVAYLFNEDGVGWTADY